VPAADLRAPSSSNSLEKRPPGDPSLAHGMLFRLAGSF
jgi:hypothetical protein